jgi:cytokinin dehydrogenase
MTKDFAERSDGPSTRGVDGRADGRADHRVDRRSDHRVDRRTFLKASAAGTLVAGLCLGTRRWVAHAATMASDVAAIPALDGSLVFDPEILAPAADDFGHIVSEAPWAVLFPGSVDDVVAMVRFARQHHLRIAGRNAFDDSHSTFGQAQVAGGIVIDMASMAGVPDIGPNDDEIWIEAGARWRDVAAQAFAAGKSPPVFPDYTGTTLGGTLSAGGIGGQSHRDGLLVDNVTALEVVTGNGDRVVCSPDEHEYLFSSVLGGLGQFAIIVKARVRLRDVPSEVRVYSAYYDDLRAFMSDQERLIDEQRFDYVEGFAERVVDRAGWVFRLEAAKYFDPASPPDNDALLADLAFRPGSDSHTDTSYLDFINRLDPLVELLRAIGVWFLPHPWLNLFLPADAAPALIQSFLDRTTDADMGQGPILIYPFRRDRHTARYPVLPDTPVCYLFSLLRTAMTAQPAEMPAKIAALLAQNRAFFEEARAHGGTFYPVNSLALTPEDWRAHFGGGLGWGIFALAKHLFDRRRVLTPGQRIFALPRGDAEPAG